MTDNLTNTIARWTQIGAAFGAAAAGQTPDLERLIIDTADVLPESPRLLVVAASWLAIHTNYVAKHWLAHLIESLEDHRKTPLGLLLDSVRLLTDTKHFNDAIKACEPSKIGEPQPLLLAQRSNAVWRRVSEKEASDLSRRWGLWCQPFEIKTDAVRPARWIIEHNPNYRARALLGGDLRLTVLLALDANRDARHSELRLADLCGASRAAVRGALSALEEADLVRREPTGRRTAIRPVPFSFKLKAA